MSYVRKVLLPGETVIYETGLHWLVYGRAIVLFVIAVALSVGALYLPHDSQNMVLGKKSPGWSSLSPSSLPSRRRYAASPPSSP
jgi:hypothetical protein